MNVVVEPAEALFGEVDIPGDKSLSHRSIMLAAISDKPTYISGFLSGLDTLASLSAIEQIGISVQQKSGTELYIQGQGLSHFTQLLAQKNRVLDFHNAGTGIRLFSGLLASACGQIKLTGDASLCARPMKRITVPLRQMGVDIRGAFFEHNQEERAPLFFNSSKSPTKLTPIHYVLPQASAQVKSCLLLAGLFAKGETTLVEPIQTRDHTERMLVEFGAKIKKQEKKISIEGDPLYQKLALKNGHYEIVRDFSSAAFFIVGALIAKKAELLIRKIGLNPSRTGLLTVLLKMGADIKIINTDFIQNEPIGDLMITSKNKLTGVSVSPEMLALMIDEFPIFLLAALKATGPTIIEGIEELAYKESNRVETMVKGLSQLGAKFDLNSIEGKLIIYPLKKPERETETVVLDSAKDHRVAMSLFMASLLGGAPVKIQIQAIENIETSFPNFFEQAKKVGFCFNLIINQGGAKCRQERLL